MAGIDPWWDDLTRDRSAAILELVLNAIADDYEDLEIILRTINQCYQDVPEFKGWRALQAVPVSRPEVVKALRELVEEGFARAFVYDAGTKNFRAVSFRQHEAGMLWFYVTEKGLRTASRLHK
ncbi:MAG TPA: hypothetical protein VFY05_06495 [Candidatus Angelobacter sp.]|nr:hypothetical protein [Candidatus Angelobacter sp.]